MGRYVRPKYASKFRVKGMQSIGRAIILRQNEKTSNLEPDEASAFFDKVPEMMVKEHTRYAEMFQITNGYTYEDIDYLGNVFATFNYGQVMNDFRKFVLTNKRALHIAFSEAVDRCTSKGYDWPWMYNDEKFKSMLEEHKQRIASILERIEFRKRYESIDYDFVVVLERFRRDIFYKMPKHLKGVIIQLPLTKNETKEAMIYAKEFHIPVIQSNTRIRHHNLLYMDEDSQTIEILRDPRVIKEHKEMIDKRQIGYYNHLFQKHPHLKVYASIVDSRYVEEIIACPWYQGVGLYKSEFFFHAYGGIPPFEELVSEYISLFKPFTEKEFFFELPDFRPEVTIKEMYGEMTDYPSYMYYPYVIDQCLNAIGEAIKETKAKVRIVVPMIRMESEMDLWRAIVEIGTESYVDEYIPVGYMVETETALENFEAYDGLDFTHIGLDNIVEEYADPFDHVDRYTPISRKEFMHDYAIYIRDAHQHYRYHRRPYIRHFISGHATANMGIFDRLTKMGLREISIPANAIEHIHEVILDRIRLIGSHEACRTDEEKSLAFRITQKYHFH